MKVIIIEDEKKIASDMKRMLKKLDPGIEIMAMLESIQQSVKWLQTESRPDMIFMDIQLADGLSFQIFQKVSIISPVIFCTAYDKYALDTFKSNGIDYILKPITEESLAAALRKVINFKNQFLQDRSDLSELLLSINKSTNAFKTSYLVSYKSKMLPIPVTRIAYFMIREGMTTFYCKDEKNYPISKNLDELENELDPKQFYRANRQYLVSYDYIKEIEHYLNRKLELILTISTDDAIMVSKEKASEFLSWMENR